MNNLVFRKFCVMFGINNVSYVQGSGQPEAYELGFLLHTNSHTSFVIEISVVEAQLTLISMCQY
jgi:hypothetical protein